MIDGIIAIVGRPNVGKSSLFNRIIGERKSIVHEDPGITRDRIYAKTSWLTKDLRLIDTGGLQIDNQLFDDKIKMQVDLAIDEADLIIFVVSALEGLTRDDEHIGRLLRETKKPVLLVANKVDDQSIKNNIYEFYNLGYGEPYSVSTAHGIGTGDVLDWVIKNLPDKKHKENKEATHFAVTGQPNVGKSSLVNSILNQDRVIVSDIGGTTRDAIDTPFKYDGKDYVIIDTAGIRKRGKVYEDVEKYSVLRAMGAIERADVILFLIDGEEGIRAQDKNVAGLAHEAGKPIVILYNKWDAVDKDTHRQNLVEKEVRSQFQYLSYAPILFISALTKKGIHRLLPLIDTVYENSNRRIQTSVINEVIHDAARRTPPPSHGGRRLKLFYASQVSTAPPTFVIFVNDPELCHFSYKRYLENFIRDTFEFEGTPIRILLRERGA